MSSETTVYWTFDSNGTTYNLPFTVTNYDDGTSAIRIGAPVPDDFFNDSPISPYGLTMNVLNPRY